MTIWESVDEPTYYRRVLGNMVGHRPDKFTRIFVRFGTQGRGVHPNYQIETVSGEVFPYRGQNHEEFVDAPDDEFDTSHLSEKRYNYEEVQGLLKSSIERTGRK